MADLEGRIVAIHNNSFSSCAIKQGVKGGSQRYYDNSSQYHGGNGTYAFNHQSFREILMKVYVYDGDNPDGGEVQSMDIYDHLKRDNGWERITDNRLRQVRHLLEGKKIYCNLNANGSIDVDNLFNLENIANHTAGNTIRFDK